MPEPAWKGRIGQARPRIRTEWNSKLRAGAAVCATRQTEFFRLIRFFRKEER